MIMKRGIHVLATVALLATVNSEKLGARGFGGFHGGGGFSAGGLRGGAARFEGPRGGSMTAAGARGRSFNSGGFRSGAAGGAQFQGPRGASFSAGGARGGSFNSGGFRGGGAGGAQFQGARGGSFSAGRASPTPGGLNSFLGLPSDGGLDGVSRAVEGPRGTTAERGAVVGPRGGMAVGGAVTGPFGGTAVRGAAIGPRGNVVGGRAARGALGNAAGQGFAAGPRGLRTISAARLHTGAAAVRRGFHGRDLYSRSWFARYPGAWAAAGWGAGYAWRAASWNTLDGWFAYGNVEPVYYDYGNNITFQDNSVYINGQDVGTTQQYYDQAQELASTGAQADASKADQWMPLGVFAMSKAGHDSANMDFQLAVNKDGLIRGNYTNPVSNNVEPIHGSVDKQTQRAAWSVGSNKSTVIETGIYNLTKDEAPALVHFGGDRTEQWILVRIRKDQTADDTATSERDK